MPRFAGRTSLPVSCLLVATLALAGCSGSPSARSAPTSSSAAAAPTSAASSPPPRPRPAPPFRHPIPGMPRPVRGDVYAATRPGHLARRVAHEPAYLYVPNSYGAPITTVIDQRTRKVVRVLHTGLLSQHVTPSYDLRTLYVEASDDNRIDAINPHTGRITHRY